jgi:hypothetical protein
MMLPVCPKCGWYRGDSRLGREHHEEECDPKRGQIADRLIQAYVAAGGKAEDATKLGYGFGHVAFKLAQGCTFSLSVESNGSFGSFSFRHVFASFIEFEAMLRLLTAMREALNWPEGSPVRDGICDASS